MGFHLFLEFFFFLFYFYLVLLPFLRQNLKQKQTDAGALRPFRKAAATRQTRQTGLCASGNRSGVRWPASGLGQPCTMQIRMQTLQTIRTAETFLDRLNRPLIGALLIRLS